MAVLTYTLRQLTGYSKFFTAQTSDQLNLVPGLVGEVPDCSTFCAIEFRGSAYSLTSVTPVVSPGPVMHESQVSLIFLLIKIF